MTRTHARGYRIITYRASHAALPLLMLLLLLLALLTTRLLDSSLLPTTMLKGV